MLALDSIIGIKPDKCLQMETFSLLIIDVLNFLNFDFWQHSFFECMDFIIKPSLIIPEILVKILLLNIYAYVPIDIKDLECYL